MSLVSQFDPTNKAVINPSDFIAPIKDFPKVVVSTFSRGMVERYVKRHRLKEIASSSTAGGKVPIYGVTYGGVKMALYMSPVGAPAAACLMEEVAAMGAESFVFFGACGVLERKTVDGHFVVPSAAVRDEGTSHHYLPRASEIQLQRRSVANITATFDAIGFPYVVSKTWTTDAIYRETHKNVRARKKQGCTVVEMECAALAAVAQFRGLRFAQFLYATDNLDAPEWQPRGLVKKEHGVTHSEKYLAAALECGLRFV